MNNKNTSKLITTTAFIIGLALIDDLNSTEQNALGNYLMLIGQVLCTNSSEHFKRDWNGYVNNQKYYHNNETDKEYTLRILKKTRDIFDKEINNLK